MNKLRQILQFIKALLGFLLNLKKKETNDEERRSGCTGQSARSGLCVIW
ncbi:hypothetical protein [Parabacteroides faecis]|uniref:RepA leader peptide Tap n=1 Tax=Parabacteroides faecis TaxID=1217282 RepID=A0ABR6KKU5_9BACT|nr:hypothetical protein [Parabacteroides faecis]MBB4622116.1 hypothetical protein [Parabacteroides faecis]